MNSQSSVSGRCPLAGIALVVVAGTAAGLCFRAHLPLLLIAAWVLVFLAAIMARFKGSGVPLLCSLFLAAWVHASLHENNPSPRHLSAILHKPYEHVEVVGVIADDPTDFCAPGDSMAGRRFTFRISGLRRAGSWQRASGHVAVFWRVSRDATPVMYGQEWKLRGVLSRDSVRRSGLWAGPAHRFRVDTADELLLAEGKGNRFIRYGLDLRRLLERRLEMGVERYPDAHGMVKAMLLGYRQDVSPALREAFSVTGTLHVLAVSGLHVGILVMLCVAIVRLLGVPSYRYALYLVPLLLLYAVLTGLRASTVRAALMAAVLLTAPLLGRRPNLSAAIAWAALLILVVSPGQLFDPGFIFSFVAVLGLVVFTPRIMRFCGVQSWVSEPWAVSRPDRMQRVLRGFVFSVCATAATSVAVWVVTAPLTVRWFHLCSPISIIGNLLVIPMAFAVVFTGVLSAVCGAIHPVVAEVFNHANRVFVDLLLLWVGKLALVPGGHFRVGTIPDVWIFAWYLILFLLVTARAYLRKAIMPLTAVGITAAVFCWWGSRDGVRVVLLEESDSCAVLVSASGGLNVLVNTGPAYRANEVVRALRHRGINRIDALVVGHANAAHMGGALDILRAFPVRAIWSTPRADQSPVCRALFREAESRGIPVRRRVAGDRGMVGDVEWEVLHPCDSSRVRRSSEGVMVLRFARNGGAVLLMNEADRSVEQSILDRAVDPAAEVMLVGGRRMAGICSSEWLDAVRPHTVLVGTGAGSRWVEPDRDVLVRLRMCGVNVLRTDETGTVDVLFDKTPEYAGGIYCRVHVSR